MENNFIYTGKVTISMGKKRVTSYNKGTTELFRIFAQALISDTLINTRPTTFQISGYNNSTSVAILRYETVGEDSTTARFLGYLTNKINANTIKLMNGTVTYAEVELDEEQKNILSSVTSQKSALIQWDLTVGNR